MTDDQDDTEAERVRRAQEEAAEAIRRTNEVRRERAEREAAERLASEPDGT